MKAVVELFLGAIDVTIRSAIAIAGAIVGMYVGAAFILVLPLPLTQWLHEHWLPLRNDLTIPWDFISGLVGAGLGAFVALRLLRRPLERLNVAVRK